MFSFLFLHQSVNRLQTWILGEKLGESYFLPTNIQKRQSRMKNSTFISLLMTRLIISEVHTSLIWVTPQTVPPQVLCTDNITQKLISKLEIKEKSLKKTLQTTVIYSSTGEIIQSHKGTFKSHYLGFMASKFTTGANLLSFKTLKNKKKIFIKHNDQTHFMRLWRALSFIEHVTSHQI